jgi:hypothetical protein
MSADVRWQVYRDGFPFAAPAELGELRAPDEATARQRAKALFGPPVLVRALLSLEAARRSPALPRLVKPAHHGAPRYSKSGKRLGRPPRGAA